MTARSTAAWSDQARRPERGSRTGPGPVNPERVRRLLPVVVGHLGKLRELQLGQLGDEVEQPVGEHRRLGVFARQRGQGEPRVVDREEQLALLLGRERDAHEAVGSRGRTCRAGPRHRRRPRACCGPSRRARATATRVPRCPRSDRDRRVGTDGRWRAASGSGERRNMASSRINSSSTSAFPSNSVNTSCPSAARAKASIYSRPTTGPRVATWPRARARAVVRRRPRTSRGFRC